MVWFEIVCVESMIFKRLLGSDKNKHDIFFVRNGVVEDTSCYLRNLFISNVACCSIFIHDMVVYMILFGGMHLIYQTKCIFSCCCQCACNATKLLHINTSSNHAIWIWLPQASCGLHKGWQSLMSDDLY